ncbi:T9SS type A sorting domain-containing protein [Flexithrix dorotheae]|uniref:type IX secretion system anionic LPS delivery protein PorZ n=1 Tax=Flexithrix dorotheae TaxID=70993 RepID=UPI0003647513|nr:T9SS type A sorting domain-containing protein [Flexithrix dorotheae]
MGIKTINFFLFLFSFHFLFAQKNIPVGSWRTHLTYHNAEAMTVADGKVYCSSENGLFYFDQQDKSLNVLSKVNDLSDVGITSLNYSSIYKTLVIGYYNGNIDLINEDGIVNIRSILNAEFEEKRINHISFFKNFAFLSTSFGVVQLDIIKYEIKESYTQIGNNAAQIEVFASANTADSLYLASEQGLMTASLADDVNRIDFNNWRTINTAQTSGIYNVAALNKTVFFTIENDGLYHYQKDDWQKLPIAENEVYHNLNQAENQVLLSTTNEIFGINSDFSIQSFPEAEINSPKEAGYDLSGTLWFADQTKGLVAFDGNNTQNYIPEGTFDPSNFSISFFQNKILVTSGGYDNNYTANGNYSGFYVFEDGKWTNYTSLENNELELTRIPDLPDLNSFSYNEINNTGYLSSFGKGLLQWNLTENDFSPVLNAPFRPSTSGDTLITGVFTDFNGTVWVANHGVEIGNPSIHSLNLEGEWQSYYFAEQATRFPLSILEDDFASKWVRLSPDLGGGILVFNDNGESRYLTDQFGQGELPNKNINAMEKDLNGSIWVGTDEGVAEFFSPGSAFTEEGANAVTPRFEGRPLLSSEKITALAVDGGNRKWIGTNNGIWLFSSDGSELISFFDQDNSPLLSNEIIDIGIHPVTGEVFIGTSLGLISYRGTATTGEQDYSNVKIFPNPVRPNYNGLVSISGLTPNSSVKITDITGKLIWDTQANGGTATWNVANYNGEHAKTGVYLVYSASVDGEDAFVGKIAVIE